MTPSMVVLEDLREKIGILSTEALRRGGEPLLERVEQALGVALRHSDRVANGVLPFNGQVCREMVKSIERAEQMIEDQP